MNKKEKLRKEYTQRINAAMDYINENLCGKIRLEDIAKSAYFSPFHFHRIFSALVGETVNEFINRSRVEKAASSLIRNYDYSISEIAERSGFNSPSSFSRAFKKYYGMSATEMQDMTSSQYSKICKVDSKNGKTAFTIEDYICNVNKILKNMNVNVEVKEMPEFKLAYIRHIGEYSKMAPVYENLMNWGKINGVLNKETKAIAIYHDDPKVTEINKVRTSVCITCDQSFKGDREIGSMTLKAGKYAVGRVEIKQEEFEEAWTYMHAWTLENGFNCGDGEYYEIYNNNFKEHPEGKHIVDICIPVK